MPRVAGVDPGTISFDLCVLEDGAPVVERTFPSPALAEDPGDLLAALAAHGPYDLVYGPSGYGLPLVAAADVGARELAEMVLVRRDEAGTTAGVGGLRRLLRALIATDLPVVFGPGAIHLPTVPGHRKYNRIDIGTADKVCAAAWAIADQAARRSIAVGDTAMVLLELGGAFSAALAIAGGEIVDGAGGSSGPIGVRAAGGFDGEVAYLLGPALAKGTLFSGGALDPEGTHDPAAPWRWQPGSAGWAALAEGAVKTVRALTATVPRPHEIVVSGRMTAVGELVDALGVALADIAPVVTLPAGAASSAARGGALLADGLAGGAHAPLVAALRLREASGSVLDHLRVAGADAIELG
jgi:predicted butyrate kinase (DUF1464 family)